MSSALQHVDVSALRPEDYQSPLDFNRLYHVNFRGDNFNPRIRNNFKFTRSGGRLVAVLTEGGHHCKLLGGRPHAVERGCYQDIHQSYCQHPILLPPSGYLELNWRMRLCGERFAVFSDGCATHPRSRKDANNFLTTAARGLPHGMPLLLPHEMPGYDDNPENPGISVEMWNAAVRIAQEELAVKVAELKDSHMQDLPAVAKEDEATPELGANNNLNGDELDNKEEGTWTEVVAPGALAGDWQRHENQKSPDSASRVPAKLRRTKLQPAQTLGEKLQAKRTQRQQFTRNWTILNLRSFCYLGQS